MSVKRQQASGPRVYLSSEVLTVQILVSGLKRPDGVLILIPGGLKLLMSVSP